MRFSPRIHRWITFLIPVLFLGAAGCGKSTGTITGKVSYKNTPLKGGFVTFMSADKQTSISGEIQEDGSYKVEKVPPGDSIICVDTSTFRPMKLPTSQAPPGMENPNAPNAGDQAAKAKRYVAIPEKYSQPDSSGMKYTVKTGTQEKEIKLD